MQAPVRQPEGNQFINGGQVVNANQKYRILLVDDEPNILESMAMVLKSDGYQVSTAIHGFDALDQIELALPDLVISDLNMPQMSGFELLPIVRERYPMIPLIAISGIYDSADRAPEGVVAEAFYAKGHHRPERLLRTIAELLQTWSAPQASFPPFPALLNIVQD